MAKVREWKASYYVETKRVWVYGSLFINPRFICFTEESEASNRINFKVYFGEFLEIKKETTTVFYSALTVRTKDKKHWFSSLQSRTNTFNVLEHFWKEALFSTSSESPSNPSVSPGGQELLNLLNDSATVLSTSARAIERQGKQIDHACQTMNKLHNDLGVAETLIHSLGAWVNQWNLETPNIYINVPETTDDIAKTEFPIIYANGRKSKKEPGAAVLSNHKLEIFNAERQAIFEFELKRVNEIVIHTPWEMTINRASIGQPDCHVIIMSARLVQLLSRLEVAIGSKMIFEDPPEGVSKALNRHRSDDELTNSLQVDGEYKISSKGLKTVSDREAAEMTQILQDMKSMALGIQNEQTRQLGQLDCLSDSLDKANERVRKDAKNIIKLL
ncbi:predicted protein [Nematostella vectensis]|uniref:Synaptosomal-associated protein 47 n=1 Tax=Nematostella vectensis TaxID=45351 RepID=A7RGF3_NEMVE|nr:predicted protein [Nematostella vectensis]|eukprot:XP_001641481.1 predicted protein [Nematostella vectensis]